MNIAILWLCLVTVSQPVHSVVITVNNYGVNSIFCCTYGLCLCNSLSNALSSIGSNTVINISSPIVSLDVFVYIQNANNITITSNDGATIACSNVGSILFSFCGDVSFEGITWDQCGDLNDLNFPGITFYRAFSNISIINCTFQHFKVCEAVYIINSEGSINVVNSKFVHNIVSNASLCSAFYGSFIVTSFGGIDITIYNSLFYYNGNSYEGSGSLNGSLLIAFGENLMTHSVLVRNCSFVSNGIRALYIGDSGQQSIAKVTFDEVIVSDNRFGIYALVTRKFSLISSHITHNSNGALDMQLVNGKNGSALQVAKSFLKFYSTTFFQDNSARSGAAIYIAESSQISVDDESTVQFINNTASLRGGAMYIDLTGCYNCGVIFANFSKYDSFTFINNSAKLSGNSMYFNIPESCDVVRDYNKADSTAYVPYRFNYTQSQSISVPEIAASPYEIKLCSFAMKYSSKSSVNNSVCVIMNDAMLGEPIYFNTILWDYFNNAAEATKFQVICINCGFKYRPVDDEILIRNGSSNRIKLLSLNANRDLESYTNITFNISSILSPEYKQIIATLSLTLSPCNNGFIFNEASQQCECYSKDDQIQCDGVIASIKLGYWFGIISEKHIFTKCHYDYCNFFTHRKQTTSGFYNLPEETNDQCNSHRTGVACGECSEGYTLAYNSPDCVSIDKCSPGMTILVVILTALYWIAIIAILFGVAYYLSTRQVSLGYLYGITFFYSIVDILLVTNLHKSDGVFYTATILSSFAKLNPQFLGRLCFIENLDAIDQQFIHYTHVVFTSIILIAIYIAGKCNNRAFSYVNQRIVPVTGFLLIFAYTSLTSTSLLLLRAVKFDGIDGLYAYLSPHLKYFVNRHAAYASVAILCGLLVTIGFPFLLLIQPLMIKICDKYLNKSTWKLNIEAFMKKNVIAWVKLVLDKLQDCYKDQHCWFAAYYLICRLVIMLITYYANDDYNYDILPANSLCCHYNDSYLDPTI